MSTDVKLIERLRDAQAEGVGSAKLFNLLDEAAAALEAAREDAANMATDAMLLRQDAERWRTYEAGDGEGTSHVCVKCGHPYWPEGENEDCPKCGHDGSAIDQARGKGGAE